jgi:hypothetical protein
MNTETKLHYTKNTLSDLIKACLQYRIGEHDMVRCRICDQEGHNDVFGDYYGIKHTSTCAYVSAVASQKELG